MVAVTDGGGVCAGSNISLTVLSQPTVSTVHSNTHSDSMVDVSLFDQLSVVVCRLMNHLLPPVPQKRCSLLTPLGVAT